MKDRPILMSAPMVRATLREIDPKTQTRRVVKMSHRTPGLIACLAPPYPPARPHVAAELCPYGQPGDRLWVRETWAPDQYRADVIDREPDRLAFAADFIGEPARRWRPSIHMPRAASRITLEITGVRVERLQCISEADARAEGITYDPGNGGVFNVPNLADCMSVSAADSFRKLWSSINGPESWASNPWVWVVEFKRVTQGDR